MNRLDETHQRDVHGWSPWRSALATTMVVAMGVLMGLFFMWLPTEGTTLGIDLLVDAFRDGTIVYREEFGLLNPPWSVLPMLLLGWFPADFAWGVIAYLFLLLLLLAVPRFLSRWRFWLGIALLTTSYPALRMIADAQFEWLVVAGLLLIWHGYARQSAWVTAFGLLHATAKPQMVWFAMLVVGLFILQTWPLRRWLWLGALVSGVVGAALLWKGPAWWVAINNFAFDDSLIDASLSGTFARLGVPTVIFAVVWGLVFLASSVLLFRSSRTLSREQLGFAVITGMLLAPYTGGNGAIVPLAIGVITQLEQRFVATIGIFAAVNAGFFLNRPAFAPILMYYITATFVLIWLFLAWVIFMDDVKKSAC